MTCCYGSSVAARRRAPTARLSYRAALERTGGKNVRDGHPAAEAFVFRGRRLIGRSPLPKHVMFGRLASGGQAWRGGRENNWMECHTEDRKASGAVGSTGENPKIFGVGTNDRAVAARKVGKRYAGVVEQRRSMHKSLTGSENHRGQHPPREKGSQADSGRAPTDDETAAVKSNYCEAKRIGWHRTWGTSTLALAVFCIGPPSWGGVGRGG